MNEEQLKALKVMKDIAKVGASHADTPVRKECWEMILTLVNFMEDEDKKANENRKVNEDDKLLIRKLREETGCGMMDCKRAYYNFNGNMEKAKNFLLGRERYLDATFPFRTRRPQ